jgi:5-(carboxyamino)imidazole ribonucleotide synthase
VGILGDGQLAQMLCFSAHAMGLKCAALSASSVTPPVEKAGAEIIQGTLSDKLALQKFLELVDVVVFENEFVDCEKLLEVAQNFPDVSFVPEIKVMEKFRDKLTQKDLMAQVGLPTASYVAFDDGKESLAEWLSKVLKKFNNKCVLKWGRFGYDGKGVFLFDGSDKNAAQRFCEVALSRKVSLFAEEKIDYRRELAMIGCYSKTGEFTSYPLTVTEQRNGICRLVYGPATRCGVDSSCEVSAQKVCSLLASQMGLHGVFAIEFFETASGSLLVNEIAPRVHNTGHYTQNASTTSQFENHWRAVLGIPLGLTKTSPVFAMINLLGPNVRLNEADIKLPVPPPSAHLHWYAKSEVIKDRKLGHLNAAGESEETLPELVRSLEECSAKWESSLQ